MYTVYVIKSETTGRVYTGQTENLENRLARHNGLLSARSRSYTKINKGPWIVVYQEEYGTREEAMKREKYLKSHVGRDWLKKVINKDS